MNLPLTFGLTGAALNYHGKCFVIHDDLDGVFDRKELSENMTNYFVNLCESPDIWDT